VNAVTGGLVVTGVTCGCVVGVTRGVVVGGWAAGAVIGGAVTGAVGGGAGAPAGVVGVGLPVEWRGIVAPAGVVPRASVVVDVVVAAAFGVRFGFGSAPGFLGLARGIAAAGAPAVEAVVPITVGATDGPDADAVAPIDAMIERNADRLSPATSRRVAAAGCRRRTRPAGASLGAVTARRADSRAIRASRSVVGCMPGSPHGERWLWPRPSAHWRVNLKLPGELPAPCAAFRMCGERR
jgi:hypothetical protein